MRIFNIIRNSAIAVALLAAVTSVQSCSKQDDVQFMAEAVVFDSPFDSAMTRGAALTTATLNSFNVTAFLDDENSTQFMQEEEVTRPSGRWTYGPQKFWPANEAVHFFAYASSKKEGVMTKPEFVKVDESKFQATFKYTHPESSASKRDAEIQPDLVFAFQNGRTAADGKVQFTFSHALTAIQFEMGDVPANTTLEAIELVNVRTGAECVVTGNLNNDITFNWGDPQHYVVFVQKYPSLPLSDGTVVSRISQETTFMMIPQTCDKQAYLRMKFMVDGESKDCKISLDGTTWKPGEIHTYTISLN